MKVLLTAINAKYIHSNLAIYSLKEYAEQNLEQSGIELCLAEYTINQQFDEILQDIYRNAPDVLALSCYLWNITIVRELVKEYRKLFPNAQIWLGGPEVSFDPVDCLTLLSEADGIMTGEGEETFIELLTALKRGANEEKEKILGIVYRSADGIQVNPRRLPLSEKQLVSPYQKMENFDEFEHKIIYYESSRGCPYSCSYCLSSVDKTVRFRELSAVIVDLERFVKHKVRQVKFVDRTFNCKKAHALGIWRWIAEHDNGITNFHFEIAGDRLGEEEITLLQSMRPGLIQLEIGIQSANERTLSAINRQMNLGKLEETVFLLQKNHNIHLHLDLIAGLPFEGYSSFAESFQTVYAMRPEQLQLGFLKVLKGSPMHEMAREYGIAWQDRPPYEVLFTKWLSYSDIIRLKQVEEVLELYYNSGQFQYSMQFVSHYFISAFRMYEALAELYDKKQLDGTAGRLKKYEILLQFMEEQFIPCPSMEEHSTLVRELVFYDLCLRDRPKARPAFAMPQEHGKVEIRTYTEQRKQKEGSGRTHIEYVTHDVVESARTGKAVHGSRLLVFDYNSRDRLSNNAVVKEVIL